MASKLHRKRNTSIKYTRCTGELSWREFRTSIRFSIICNSNGTVKVNINSIPLTQDTAWLLQVFHQSSSVVPYLNLAGADGEGNFFQSEHIYLTSNGTRSTPRRTSITLGAQAAALEVRRTKTLDLASPAPDAMVRYRTIGMTGFRGVSALSNVGEITLAGPTRLDDFEQISGVLQVRTQGKEQASLETWLKDCDTTARSVLDIISLAEGNFIRWSVRELFIGNELAAIWFLSSRASNAPRDSLYTNLNLGPFLNLALSSYTPELKQNTGLDVAIEWFLMEPRYVELQFLAAMTALEHLVQVYSSRNDSGGLFPSKYFAQSVKPLLESTLQHIERNLDGSVPEKERIIGAIASCGLGNLNGKSLKIKISEMLRFYEVPINDIEGDIQDLTATRNRIAHTGSYRRPQQEGGYIHHQLGVLRELLKRIFMKLLGYQGQYHSSLAGLPWMTFPLSGRTQSPE